MSEILKIIWPYIERASIVAGVIGLPLSFYALIEAKRTKNLFQSKARLPQLMSALEKYASKLNQNIAIWDESNHNHLEGIDKIIETLKITSKIATGSFKKSIQEFSETIEIVYKNG